MGNVLGVAMRPVRRQLSRLLKEIVFEIIVFIELEADEDTDGRHIDLPLSFPGSFYNGALL